MGSCHQGGTFSFALSRCHLDYIVKDRQMSIENPRENANGRKEAHLPKLELFARMADAVGDTGNRTFTA